MPNKFKTGRNVNPLKFRELFVTTLIGDKMTKKEQETTYIFCEALTNEKVI